MVIASRRRSGIGRSPVILADVVERMPRAEVDVALVLAIDSSGSVSEQRLMLQIQGYIDALRNPLFIEAVQGGRHGKIALTFVEWTDVRRQDQAVGWRLIHDTASAETVGSLRIAVSRLSSPPALLRRRRGGAVTGSDPPCRRAV